MLETIGYVVLYMLSGYVGFMLGTFHLGYLEKKYHKYKFYKKEAEVYYRNLINISYLFYKTDIAYKLKRQRILNIIDEYHRNNKTAPEEIAELDNMVIEATENLYLKAVKRANQEAVKFTYSDN